MSLSSVVGGSLVTGTVYLIGVVGVDTDVALASTDAAAASVPASVKVLKGSGSATFTITTHSVAVSHNLVIEATHVGATAQAKLTVKP